MANECSELAGERWDIRGTRLFVRSFGKAGKPALLVVHGGPGASHGKLLALKKLASKYQVVFYDQRGTGDSDRFEIDSAKPALDLLSLEQNIEDIEAIRRRLGKDRISLIGHSWGGALVTFYAANYPARVDKLVVYSGGPEDLALCEEKERRHAAMRSPDENTRLKAGVEELEKAVKAGKPQEELDRIFTDLILIACPSLYFRRRSGFLKPDKCGFWANQGASSYSDIFDRCAFAQKLRLIRCPTLLIWGRHEPSPRERLLYLLEHLEDARFVTFENSGHNAMEEEPELFFRTLWAFFNEQELPIPALRSRPEGGE